MARNSSELKTEFVRWLHLPNKPGKLFLWNDELGEGLNGFELSWMDEVRLGLLVMRSLCTVETHARHQSLEFIYESCQTKNISNKLRKQNSII